MFTAVHPHSVLMVEDNRDGADSLALFLCMAGYSVRVTYDGQCAFQAIQSRSYDAVLSDIGLPGRNGYEVAREARRVLGDGALLVAVTAYDAPMVREAAQAAGFDYFFVKPVDPDELDHLLQEHCSRIGY